MKKKIIFSILFLLLCILLGFLLFSVECKIEKGWMCSVCGTTKEQVEWFNSMETAPVVKNSPLAIWLQQKEIEHSHDWNMIGAAGKNLLGIQMSCGLGSAPVIINFPEEFMDLFLQRSTEEEILAFYEMMKNGSKEEQEARIDEICDSIYKQEMPQSSK